MTGELLLVTGPPAVGKMTVGRALCARSDFRLFHNHHTIEPLIEVFGHGTPAFTVLNEEFRRRVVEEAARSGTRLVFTFVWAVDLEEDAVVVSALVRPYLDAGLPVSVLELTADLGTRLARNTGADRIAAKPSKADLAWSDAHVREIDQQWRMATDPDHPSAADAVIAAITATGGAHLRLDNTDLTADDAAVRALAWLDRR
ncbi:hypothetical protein ENKNEFLB_03660 [Nocardioides aquaticus]|uniref:Shikimate kinase n=1 Tax=Nocardioides aquaticus TaxID=160826 RepID=A0ABX8EL39_9ACTN|nr:AAA family ATPase [Nocardioides aquaticus]QVT81252.1 hypothetical protein ENKNEFLB_03660 [Nocardioides aquaticus]